METSRREFLKSATLATLGIKATHSENTVSAQEIKENDSLEKGLTELHRRALLDTSEVAAFYVAYPGSRRPEWKTAVATTRTSKLMDLSESEFRTIVFALGEKATEVRTYHTHPISLYLPKEIIDQLRRNKKKEPFPFPPSFVSNAGAGDFAACLNQRIYFKDSIKLKSGIVGAQGIWYMEPDFNNPFVKEYLAMRTDEEIIVKKIMSKAEWSTLFNQISSPNLSDKIGQFADILKSSRLKVSIENTELELKIRENIYAFLKLIRTYSPAFTQALEVAEMEISNGLKNNGKA